MTLGSLFQCKSMIFFFFFLLASHDGKIIAHVDAASDTTETHVDVWIYPKQHQQCNTAPLLANCPLSLL